MLEWDYFKEVGYDFFFNHRKSPLVRMQFTGLHDKNGKEIYEGDIIEYSKGARWAVKYDETRGRWIVYDHENLDNRATFTLNSMRTKPVIGNIYENPNLLSV
jgi:uncharacterized phage protein (TIGR01671 family)